LWSTRQGRTALISISVSTLASADTTRADTYARASKSDRTWRQYASVWKQFEAWCSEHGHAPLPASKPTLRAYVAWLADQGRTVATIHAYLAAIAIRHSSIGQNIDREALRNDIKGIRRLKPRKTRQVKPLVASELRALMADFGDDNSAARDRLLFSLGFAGALRRSELVGLDWKVAGTGDGYISLEERGLVITLLRTKTTGGEPVEIIVPCEDMPTACDALERWSAIASLKAGEPVFREVIKGGEIGAQRLADRSVARIIKRRIRQRALELGRPESEADELADTFSGHSLRAGYCTAAAMAGVPEWKIRRRSRHRTAEMVARYVRAAEEWTDSGLKGVGF
jgi:integrase